MKTNTKATIRKIGERTLLIVMSIMLFVSTFILLDMISRTTVYMGRGFSIQTAAQWAEQDINNRAAGLIQTVNDWLGMEESRIIEYPMANQHIVWNTKDF